MISLVWFGSTRGAKIAFACFGMALLFCLILSALFWARNSNAQRDFYLVTGRVVDNFISADRLTSWSDVQFELHGQTYTVRHENFWIINHQREFLVNPDNPEHTIVATALDASLVITMITAGILGPFTLFYLINFLVNRKRDKRAGQALGIGKKEIF
ncbi:MAG: DUF3592 domain-containing protein [Clostridiales bacterium]|jgi:hypothetical protein|nr:DUF3592 domain-containing protein [Clostridiales bacterium]